MKSPSTPTLRPAAGAQARVSSKAAGRETEPSSPSSVLPLFYETLSAKLGPMHWWPAKTPFEVIAGAILTQNTAWTNVSRALDNLRQERLLTPRAVERVSLGRLARLVRPSGYFRQKARKLKAFVDFLGRDFCGSLARMFRTPTAELRERLLEVHGIGPETADSILLYAGKHAVFVVDTYTKRILLRHGLLSEKAGYEEMRELFERNLPRDVELYNEYHALIVNVGKRWCRSEKPLCDECPLGPYLPADARRRGFRA
ncbi:MAG TPA: hypothetical protein VKE24_03860 [Candidatus Acidoferrales bacterium]|nr:hypothetical protein [Candidatus Acidoferrales bacterium]